MKAIILAAGMGTRLGKYTENLPKGMLPFLGKSLIGRQVETLHSCGINDIVIVTGYKKEAIQIPNVRYYHNNDFVSTNMVETLFRAEQELQGEVVVSYSDIVYERRVLMSVLASTVDIGVTVDKDYLGYWKARLDDPGKDMESLVIDSEGKIVALGDTKCTRDQAQARYVGIIKFSALGIAALKKVYHGERAQHYDKDTPWLRSKCFRQGYMTCMLQALVNAGYRVSPIYISHGWMEFDTVEDYERSIKWHRDGSLSRFIDLNQ